MMNLSKTLIFILLIAKIQSEKFNKGSKCRSRGGFEGTCTSSEECNNLQLNLGNLVQINQETVCNDEMNYICCPAESSVVSSRSLWNLIENGPSMCGRPVMPAGTIFHGTQIKRSAYPWTAALTKSEDGNFFCGGSLISKTLVLTAAHCIEGKTRTHLFRPRDIFVILGAHNLEARHEPGRITASVKSIHIHHDWNPHIASYDADIAILELEDEITFNQYIQPICIAAPNSEMAKITEGVVIGFGRSEHRKIENIARVIPSPIHSYEFCANSSDHQNLLTHRTFCAGYANGTSVCEGDSGSGLIVKHNGIYYLRGIVSASLYDSLIGCNINTYSVFTDILEFHSWITTGKDEKMLMRELLEEIRRLKSNMITTTDTPWTWELYEESTTSTTQKSTNDAFEILSRNLNFKSQTQTTDESSSNSVTEGIKLNKLEGAISKLLNDMLQVQKTYSKMNQN